MKNFEKLRDLAIKTAFEFKRSGVDFMCVSDCVSVMSNSSNSEKLNDMWRHHKKSLKMKR